MAKSDLLKEAIADAKAVKETALANAKIALQEAFAPRIQNMLSAKLAEDLDEAEHDEMDDMGDAGMDDMGDAGMDDMADDMGQDVGDISLDTDGDGDMDFEGDIYSKEPIGDDEGMDDVDDEMSDDEMAEEYNEAAMEEGDLGLDEIIAELEEDMAMNDEELPEDAHEEAMPNEARNKMNAGHTADHSTEEEDEANEVYSESIDDIINEILAEEDVDSDKDEMAHGKKDEEMTNEMQVGAESIDSTGDNLQEALTALEESYKTVKHLKSVINEVNLLNAKLLYTNKLFRNFELSESQKMKVIENFDRASTTRETKLVFTTLAESFAKPAKKRVVKESYASRPSTTTAPSKEFKENTQILSEGFEHANRWKKLAGLI